MISLQMFVLNHRFKFGGPGLFQCSETVLVFVTTGEGEVAGKMVPANRKDSCRSSV